MQSSGGPEWVLPASVLVGVLNVLGVLGLGWFRRRQWDFKDMWISASAFAASNNVFPPFILLFFSANPATAKTLPAALHGYEWYICIAAVCSILITGSGLGSLYLVAYRRG
jgi:hypothetical protein